jgi:hypothetical protein
MIRKLTFILLLGPSLLCTAQVPDHIFGFYKSKGRATTHYLMIDPGYVIEYNEERGYPVRYDTKWPDMDHAVIGNSVEEVIKAEVKDIIIREIKPSFLGKLKATCLIGDKEEKIKLEKMDYGQFEDQAVIDDLIGFFQLEFDMQDHYIDYDVHAETIHELREGQYMELGNQAVPQMNTFTKTKDYELAVAYFEEFFGHVEHLNCLSYRYNDSLEMEYYFDTKFSKPDTSSLLELYFKPSPTEPERYLYSGLSLKAYDYVPLKPLKTLGDQFFAHYQAGQYAEIYRSGADTLHQINTEDEFVAVLEELSTMVPVEKARYYNNSINVSMGRQALYLYYTVEVDDETVYIILIYLKKGGEYKLAGISLE